MRTQLTPNRKYQVFISSTKEDMKDERRVAVEAILATHNIPVGMEQFPSGKRKSWDIIKQWIDESDIYLLIVGGRYGTLDASTGKSYTHMEYEYATQTQKPMILCVIDNMYLEKKLDNQGKAVIERDNPTKYYAFRDLVCENQCNFYSSLEILSLNISNDIHDVIMNHELCGWTRNSTTQVFGVDNLKMLLDGCQMYANHNRILELYCRLNSIKLDEELGAYYVDTLGQLVSSLTIGDSETIMEFKSKAFGLLVNKYRMTIQNMRSQLTEFEGTSVHTDYRGTLPMETYYCKKKEFLAKYEKTEAASLYPQNKAIALDNYNTVFIMGQDLLKAVEEMEVDHLSGRHYERIDHGRMMSIGNM